MHAHAMKPGPRSPRDLMACVGEASRFHLVQLLSEGARCVTDLARAAGLSQSCTTRHLQVLQRSRVVSRTRAGKRVMYELSPDEPGLAPLLAWVQAEAAAGPERRARIPASANNGVQPSHAGASGHPDDPSAASNSRPKRPGRPRLRLRPPASQRPIVRSPEAETSPPASPAPRVRRPDSIEDYLL